MIIKIMSEFFGTFLLVIVAVGVVVSSSVYSNLGLLGISLATGLIVTAIIYSLGNISGAHINPAVSIAFLVMKQLKFTEAFFYITAQISGSVAASVLLLFQFGNIMPGVHIPAHNLTDFNSVIWEVLFSFMLMFVILNLSSENSDTGFLAGAVIGATVCLLLLMGGPLTGASMNPARTLGPALVSGYLDKIWIYLLAPPLGTCMAIPVYRFIQKKH